MINFGLSRLIFVFVFALPFHATATAPISSSHIKPIEIQIWHQMIYSHREVLAQALALFEKENPEIKVRATYRETEELRSAFQSAAMGGSGPHLIYGPSDQVGPFAAMGLISPLEDYLPESFWSQFDPLAVPIYHNHRYIVGDTVGNHLMLIYNRKIIKNPPSTMTELIQLAQQNTRDLDGNKKIDQWGLVFNLTEPYFFVPWISAFGEGFLKDQINPNLNTPATQAAFLFVQSLKTKYKVIPPECDYELANALFKDGRAAFIVNGDWSWGDYQEAHIDFGVAPLPQNETTKLWPAPLVGTKGYSLNAHIKNAIEREWTLKILTFLTSARIQSLFLAKVGTLPSQLELRAQPEVQNNPLLTASATLMQHGQPMPMVPEVRAVWDSLRKHYQASLSEQETPEQAAELSQQDAEKQIQTMNEVVIPDWQAHLVTIILFLFLLLLIGFTLRLLPQFFADIRKQPLYWSMLLPALLIIFLIIVYPFFYNVLISLSNYGLRNFNNWQIIGLQNYIAVFSDRQFYTVLFKTIVWTTTNVVFHVFIGLALAVFIDQLLPAKALWRILLIIPWAVPQYITALTWRGLFNQEYGPINNFLQKWFQLEPIQWLSQPFTSFFACFITNVWLGFPFMMIVALGGLQSIPSSLYEAAKIDGASSWQRFKLITWPLLLPVMIPAALLGFIWTFNNLSVVWLVSNSGEPADQTHILVSYVYKSAFNLYRYGYAAALSLVIFTLLLIYGFWFSHKKATRETIREVNNEVHGITNTTVDKKNLLEKTSS